ncbi:hypothetical protein E1I18_02560 [Mycoplasmopsis mucosicanis]|uniref:Uncharacterized protein n=1 Tax=Mycoplasmopsis mucosicanis TaxID=458208 RepID=A0A507SPZ0_9BACT|nr:hypothetical protein [Mycoplasmopsis mucosicanis]TQC51442.1 hypothetical protein E1I18_02560 [Mycoplasmopsis mucosicanis]
MLLRNELKEYQDQINVLNMKDKKTEDEVQELENIIKIKEDLQDYLNILEIYSEFKPVQTQDALDWDKELKEFENNPNALHQLNDEVKSFQDEIDALNQKTDKSDEDNEQLKTIQEAKSNLEEFIIALEVYKDYKNSLETDSDRDWQSLLDSIKASQQAIEELTQDIAKLKQQLQQ